MTIAPIAPFGEIFAGIERKTLPLEELKVEATLEGLTSRTTVRQTFVNNLTTKLEATYIFPLPDRAAVTAFRMRIGERVVDGRILERRAAREAYEQAIDEGYRAGMAEEERPDVFTMTVGNIAPGEEITVELTLVAPLPWAGGEVTWQFPLVVAPRYIPGQPLAALPVGMGTEEDTDEVPDASRITPPLLIEGAPNPVRLSIEVDLMDAGFEIGEPHSSLHAVMSERREGSRHIRVHPGERVDRDFILRYTLSQQTSTAVVHEGTFAITLLPPPGNPATQQPRDLVFVLDRSGSMGGWKMVAARRAIGRMIDSLTDADRFAVIPFSDRIIPVPDGGGALHAATDRARFRAVEFLASLGAQGGTEMKDPLIKAAEMLRESRNGILVLVTDGQIGNEDAVLRSLSPLLGGTRVYAVGIDQSVNAGFLNRLAKGGAELVESENRLDAVMDAMHRRIATPLITDVRVEGASDVIPSSAHLFEGAPLLLLGRSSDEASSFVVRGTRADGSAWSATVPATTAASDAVTKIWARARVRALEDEYAVRSNSRIGEKIVATSLQYGVLSRFTAWLAIDTVRGDIGGEMAKIVQPVERAAGWDMLRSRTMAARMAEPMAMAPPDERGVLYASMEPVFEYAPLADAAFDPSLDAEESLLQRLERTPTGDRRDAVRDAAIEIEALAALHSSKRLERIAKLASHADTLDDQEFAKLWDELIEALHEIDGGSPRRQRATRRREFWK